MNIIYIQSRDKYEFQSWTKQTTIKQNVQSFNLFTEFTSVE